MIEYPIRINKYLAYKKICSRREADQLIDQKKVRINGTVAKLGDMVAQKDTVSVDTESLNKRIYIAFNKPKGIVTHSPRHHEQAIEDIITLKQKVSPIGRLDKESHGLILLSNDGRLTGALLNPEHDHEKEYSVVVNKPLSNEFLTRMKKGVTLDDGYKTKPVQIIRTATNQFTIILTEGKNRQIRRMCKTLGYRVSDLKRVRIMNIKLNDLPLGTYRILKGKELSTLLRDVGL